MSLGTLNVSRSIIHGTAWMVGMRWTLRGLGLVNTFILARLLNPGDFGLVAMAMLTIGLVEVLGQTGQMYALIRHPSPSRADFDSVWTLTIIIAAVLTAVLWLSAPLASWYFHEPRAGSLVQVLALRTLIGGFSNVGTVAFRKELDFAKEFWFVVLQRLLTLVATIGVAVWLRNYWALVIGILMGQVMSVGLSYVVHPYRPRLDVSRIRSLGSFSSWMLIANVAQYVQDKADELVVGGVSSAAVMGDYNVAADTATSPTIEVVLPMTRALFPIFARIADDATALRAAYLNVFSAVAVICCASATGMSLVAADFVAVALGPKWLSAIPLVQILAIAGGFYGVMGGAVTLLTATGHARLGAILSATRTAVTVPVLIVAGLFGDVETIALARTVLTALFVPGIFIALSRVLPISIGDMMSRAWRPVLAALAMAFVVRALHATALDDAWLRLILDMATGAATFTLALLGLWVLSGRPSGFEAALVDRATSFARRRLRLTAG